MKNVSTPLVFDFKGRQVFALGSAPDSFPPPVESRTWAVITVNASQSVLGRLGLSDTPAMTLMNRSVVKSSLNSSVAARKVLRGLSTDNLVVLSHKDSRTHHFLTALRLWWLGYRYRSLTVLNTRYRQQIMEGVLGDAYDQSQPPSNGIFLALLALHLGASRVLMSGFSLSKTGHVYNDLNLRRRHVDGDTAALHRMVELGLPVFTNDERFSRESGLPLIASAG